jgi:hypothetical protein
MYAWNDQDLFGETALDFAQFTPNESRRSADAFLDAASANLSEHLIPFIEAHPETQFDLFFPPYSAARWYEFYRLGQLGYHLNQKEAAVAELLPYENVRIYDFQGEAQWITNFDHYIDTSHYGPWINDTMAERMSQNECRVTSVEEMKAGSDRIREAVAVFTQMYEDR